MDLGPGAAADVARQSESYSEPVICLVSPSAVKINTFLDGSAALYEPLQFSSNQNQLGLVRRSSPGPPETPSPFRPAGPIRSRWKMTKDERNLSAVEAGGQNRLLSKFNPSVDRSLEDRDALSAVTHHTKHREGFNRFLLKLN